MAQAPFRGPGRVAAEAGSITSWGESPVQIAANSQPVLMATPRWWAIAAVDQGLKQSVPDEGLLRLQLDD